MKQHNNTKKVYAFQKNYYTYLDKAREILDYNNIYFNYNPFGLAVNEVRVVQSVSPSGQTDNIGLM